MNYNPFMVWVLYSPLHGIISSNTMAINFTGRKSGKPYRVPIGYLHVGNTLVTISFKRRTWWRNLRGGADVTLRLQGVDVRGHADVIEDEQGVIDGILAYVQQDPRTMRWFKIQSQPDGTLDLDSVQKAAEERVIVRTTLR